MMNQNQLIAKIREAFSGVQLNDGIGLYEADCIDDYLQPTDATYIYWKAKDERLDWQKLLPLFLSKEAQPRLNASCWTFMNAKGKRFALPCFLLQELQMPDADNPIYFAITSGYNFNDFEILNKAQLAVLVQFLEYQIVKHLQNKNDIEADQCKQCLDIIKKWKNNDKSLHQ